MACTDSFWVPRLQIFSKCIWIEHIYVGATFMEVLCSSWATLTYSDNFLPFWPLFVHAGVFWGISPSTDHANFIKIPYDTTYLHGNRISAWVGVHLQSGGEHGTYTAVLAVFCTSVSQKHDLSMILCFKSVTYVMKHNILTWWLGTCLGCMALRAASDELDA